MGAPAQPAHHTPVLPQVDARTPLADPLRCVKCGGVVRLICVLDPAPAKRTYKPKPCSRCTRPFTPTGPRDNICVACRGGGRG